MTASGVERASIRTRIERRDKRLRAMDLIAVERHPHPHLELDSLAPNGDWTMTSTGTLDSRERALRIGTLS